MTLLCQHKLLLSHSNPDMIERVEKAHKQGKFFQEFKPVPHSLMDKTGTDKQIVQRNIMNHGHPSPDSWRLANWGALWDVGISTHGKLLLRTPSQAGMRFDTQFEPPIQVYCALEHLGFAVLAYAIGPKEIWRGRYRNGVEVRHYKNSMRRIPYQIGINTDDEYFLSNKF